MCPEANQKSSKFKTQLHCGFCCRQKGSTTLSMPTLYKQTFYLSIFKLSTMNLFATLSMRTLSTDVKQNVNFLFKLPCRVSPCIS
jgi:hypothetical protein